MENSITATTVASAYSYTPTATDYKYEQDSLIIQATLVDSDDDDSSIVDINRLTQGLTTTASQIIEKLNGLLSATVPNGIESLNPDDFTSEKTASSIVNSITGLYANYVKSNPELSAEEALSRFMEAARSGVEKGYGDASKTLEDLGAFQFDGVKSGIEETKRLIAEKLDAFESAQKKLIESANGVQTSSTTTTTNSVLSQAGVSLVA